MNTTLKVNKAQELREKQARESLTYNLQRRLISFKERFLDSYVNYKFREFDKQIEFIKKKPFDNKNEKYGYTLEKFNQDNQKSIEIIEQQKSLKYTNTLKFINEAEENYSIKFNRLIDSLVKYGIQSYPLSIEKIGSATEYDFGFLITHKDIVVHARIIFACGEINAPHYRFITTKRKEGEEF